MKTQLLILFTVLMSITLISCSDETNFYQNDKESENTDKSDLTVFYAKSEFCKALAKVLAEKEDARVIIRDEALKKINFDNDVLYLLIKDKILKDGTTFEKNMLKHIDSVVLETFTSYFPTLTILVPDFQKILFLLKYGMLQHKHQW